MVLMHLLYMIIIGVHLIIKFNHSILRDNQAEASKMFDLTTTGINTNSSWQLIQIKDLT